MAPPIDSVVSFFKSRTLIIRLSIRTVISAAPLRIVLYKVSRADRFQVADFTIKRIVSAYASVWRYFGIRLHTLSCVEFVSSWVLVRTARRRFVCMHKLFRRMPTNVEVSFSKRNSKVFFRLQYGNGFGPLRWHSSN